LEQICDAVDQILIGHTYDAVAAQDGFSRKGGDSLGRDFDATGFPLLSHTIPFRKW
jgi:hypothetical protein